MDSPRQAQDNLLLQVEFGRCLIICMLSFQDAQSTESGSGRVGKDQLSIHEGSKLYKIIEPHALESVSSKIADLFGEG